MWFNKYIIFLGCLIQSQLVHSWISCTQDSDCIDAQGAICSSFNCACPTGQQLIFGNSLCAPAPPYIGSPCYENHQCSRLVTNFECRRKSDGAGADEEQGECYCRPGFHYLSGRCWRSIDYGNACVRDEECMGQIPDPFSMSCDSTTRVCQCSTGYYFRQRGECRRIGNGIGDACVIDEDCQFEQGACNINTFRCVRRTATLDGKAAEPIIAVNKSKIENRINKIQNILDSGIASLIDSRTDSRIASLVQNRSDSRVGTHGAACDAENVCHSPFVCSNFGACICPDGYYGFDDSNICYAELGSPSTAAECLGFLAEVRDGICTCPVNFFFSENLRDCIKVARTVTDSCIADNMCHTFGSAVRCTEPAEPWPLRNCKCDTDRSLWDPSRSLCRIFVGIGEPCQMDSDCLAGDREIECVITAGQGICRCPANTVEANGLCLTVGLELEDDCQVSEECTGTPNTVCYERKCVCGEGYLQLTDSNEVQSCVSGIGGHCAIDEDCVLDNSFCEADEEAETSTCRCNPGFLPVGDECMTALTDPASPCSVTEQCVFLMGNDSVCEESTCRCNAGYHLRDGTCWPQTGLFQDCARTSQCYLPNMSKRVVCRNSLCQCDFDYPYSEEKHTCLSAASTTVSSIATVLLAVYYVLSR